MTFGSSDLMTCESSLSATCSLLSRLERVYERHKACVADLDWSPGSHCIPLGGLSPCGASKRSQPSQQPRQHQQLNLVSTYRNHSCPFGRRSLARTHSEGGADLRLEDFETGRSHLRSHRLWHSLCRAPRGSQPKVLVGSARAFGRPANTFGHLSCPWPRGDKPHPTGPLHNGLHPSFQTNKYWIYFKYQTKYMFSFTYSVLPNMFSFF
jgi:hypothetical protein